MPLSSIRLHSLRQKLPKKWNHRNGMFRRGMRLFIQNLSLSAAVLSRSGSSQKLRFSPHPPTPVPRSESTVLSGLSDSDRGTFWFPTDWMVSHRRPHQLVASSLFLKNSRTVSFIFDRYNALMKGALYHDDVLYTDSTDFRRRPLDRCRPAAAPYRGGRSA